jgi:hypothetical protein
LIFSETNNFVLFGSNEVKFDTGFVKRKEGDREGEREREREGSRRGNFQQVGDREKERDR